MTAATVTFRRPLVDVWTAAAVLDRGEDIILSMIETGEHIEWAFQVQSQYARRRYVRILAQHVLDLAHGRPTKRLSFDEVMQLVLPGHKERERASWVARRLNISNAHMLDVLLEEGMISKRDLPGSHGKRESPFVPRRAICRWLERRRCE